MIRLSIFLLLSLICVRTGVAQTPVVSAPSPISRATVRAAVPRPAELTADIQTGDWSAPESAGEAQPADILETAFSEPGCGPACGSPAPTVCGAAPELCGGEPTFIESLTSCSWLNSDKRLLSSLQDLQITDCLSMSAGAALRFRYFDESNRLRPPVAAGRSSYQQWRFTPYVEMKYGEFLTGYAQLIDASTFDNELPILPIDENRWDLLQAYADAKIFDANYRYGRQLLSYGSQRLISPLAWGNTFRNFEGHRVYYANDEWSADALAVQPINGASRSQVYNVDSFDTPAQDTWLGGLYLTKKAFLSGSLDLYWLWSSADYRNNNVINGNRHTLGSRWAGQKKAGVTTILWDLESAYQTGTTGYLGRDQDVQAGFVSVNSGVKLDKVPWTPTLTGVFWYGSGDSNPNDGTSHTVSTLYPLGHAYWGLIDNFNGSNLLDYSPQLTLKPTQKLTLLSAWHWFDKAAAQDGIYNIAGVPFGGISTTPTDLGNELDLVATYQVNKNLQLQAGYFWFWYGDAVTRNPNAGVANRSDAENVYFFADWVF